jgi:hypothetical protein
MDESVQVVDFQPFSAPRFPNVKGVKAYIGKDKNNVLFEVSLNTFEDSLMVYDNKTNDCVFSCYNASYNKFNEVVNLYLRLARLQVY